MSEAENSKKRRLDAPDPVTSPSKGSEAVPASKKVKLDDAATAVSKPSAQDGQKPGNSSDKDVSQKHEGSHETNDNAESSKPKHGREPGTAQTSSKRLRRAKNEQRSSPTSQSVGPRIRKLAPPRPFPTVPTSVSATGPRSAHAEGKNQICITRKTELGMYLRRCKDVVLKDGYKTLHLHAMGAAIPHLARLAVSLPSILPFAASDIQTEVRTGTAELQDEVIPDDEDEDISLRTRGKSTMSVIIKIEGGDDGGAERAEVLSTKKKKKKKGKDKAKNGQSGGLAGSNANSSRPEQIVFTEGDLENDYAET